MASERRKDEIAMADESRLRKQAMGEKKRGGFQSEFIKAYHWLAHALRHAKRHTPAPISHREALGHFQSVMHRNHTRRHAGFQTAR